MDGELGHVQGGGLLGKTIAQPEAVTGQRGAGPAHGLQRGRAQRLVRGVLVQGHGGIAQQHQRALHRGGLAQRVDQAAPAVGGEVDGAGGGVVGALRVADAVAFFVLLLPRSVGRRRAVVQRGGVVAERVAPSGVGRSQRGKGDEQGSELHDVYSRSR